MNRGSGRIWKAIILLIIFTLLLSVALCGCGQEKTPPTDDSGANEQERSSVNSARELIEYVHYYYSNEGMSPDTSENHFLFDKDYSISVIYTKMDAHTTLEGLDEDTDNLPFSTLHVSKDGNKYSKLVGTVYASQNSPVEYYFREVETTEIFRDAQEQASYVTNLQEISKFNTYGEFEPTEIGFERAFMFDYANGEEYREDTARGATANAMNNLRQFAITTPFQVDSAGLGEEIFDIDLGYDFIKDEFSANGDVVTFEIEYRTEFTHTIITGTLNLSTSALTMTVGQTTNDPTLALREIAYTVEIKTQNIDSISFDTTRDFEVSEDAKAW